MTGPVPDPSGPAAVTPAGLALQAGMTALMLGHAPLHQHALMPQTPWDLAAAAGLTTDEARRHLRTVTDPPCALPTDSHSVQADELSYLIGSVAAGFPVGVFARLARHGLTAADLTELVRLADFGALAPAAAPVPAGVNGDPERLLRLLDALDVLADTAGSFRAVVVNSTDLWAGDAADVCVCLTIGEAAGLTDTQTARWIAVSGDLSFGTFESRIDEWVAAAGPDGWAWAAAGYTPAETQVLRALPDPDPGRPGPDQLAVMAALIRPAPRQ